MQWDERPEGAGTLIHESGDVGGQGDEEGTWQFCLHRIGAEYRNCNIILQSRKMLVKTHLE